MFTFYIMGKGILITRIMCLIRTYLFHDENVNFLFKTVAKCIETFARWIRPFR